MEKLSSLPSQLLNFLKGLSLGRRLALATFTLGALALGLYVALVGSRENYAVLYADLSTDDAAGISQKLKERKIPFRVTGAGNLIEVPESQVHALRLELAGDGLPRGGGAGFELFDKPRIGATEFEQQINLKRALEGELARSIATIEGVKSARVHLVLPERRLFVSRESQASASVVLKLRNPAAFSKQEVAATVHLVATAVPGLTRDRVSVVSTDGTTLHRPSGDSGVEGAGGQDLRLEQEREVRARLEEQVRTLLERVVGTGNAEVRMNVALSAAITERTLERYDPAKTALRSESQTDERTGSDGVSVAGVPGAQSNLGTAGGEITTTTDLNGNVIRHTHQRNFEIDRVLEKTKIPSGELERLSMGILINKNAGQNVTPALLAQLGDIAKQSVGFDEKRGDAFTIEAIDFAKVDLEAPEEEVVPVWEKALDHAPVFLLALLALVSLLLFARAPKRRGPVPTVAELAAPARDAAELAAARQNLLDLPAPPGAEPKELGDGSPRREEVRSKALELAAQDPATAAVILRSWLNSGPAAGAPGES